MLIRAFLKEDWGKSLLCKAKPYLAANFNDENHVRVLRECKCILVSKYDETKKHNAVAQDGRHELSFFGLPLENDTCRTLFIKYLAVMGNPSP